MAIPNPIQLNPSDALAVRQNIIGRCTAHVAQLALYHLGNVGSSTEHKAWAASAIRNSGSVGDAVSYYVMNQPSFLNGGSSIEEDELKNIVETAINNNFVAPPPPPEPAP